MTKFLKTIPFTSEKYKEMQQKVVELEELRKEVMKRLITARGMGDLSENGAYKYAKSELGDIGRQLRRFKELLAKGFVAPKNTGPRGLIDFGSEITIEKIGEQTKTTVGAKSETKGKAEAKSKAKSKSFMIVSEHESDPSIGKIAYSSPMGKAVMRKKIGDKVVVETPNGKSEWIVVEVK